MTVKKDIPVTLKMALKAKNLVVIWRCVTELLDQIEVVDLPQLSEYAYIFVMFYLNIYKLLSSVYIN